MENRYPHTKSDSITSGNVRSFSLPDINKPAPSGGTDSQKSRMRRLNKSALQKITEIVTKQEARNGSKPSAQQSAENLNKKSSVISDPQLVHNKSLSAYHDSVIDQRKTPVKTRTISQKSHSLTPQNMLSKDQENSNKTLKEASQKQSDSVERLIRKISSKRTRVARQVNTQQVSAPVNESNSNHLNYLNKLKALNDTFSKDSARIVQGTISSHSNRLSSNQTLQKPHQQNRDQFTDRQRSAYAKNQSEDTKQRRLNKTQQQLAEFINSKTNVPHEAHTLSQLQLQEQEQAAKSLEIGINFKAQPVLFLKTKAKEYWAKFLFTPKSRFKVYWDLLIIFLSIWNAIQLPLEFAFPEIFEGKKGITAAEQFTDLLFAFDILMNFRTAYVDSHTDELITDPVKIAKNYLKGRFWIDLCASIPFNDIVGWFERGDGKSSKKQLKLIGLIKLTRLLRLGRMVTYLKASKDFALGAKMGQLFFMLVLLLHWMACLWWIVIDVNKTWIPPKDTDWDTDGNIYDTRQEMTASSLGKTYILMFYYACLALLSSDYLPTNQFELLCAFALILVGSIAMGVLIGEFSTLLSDQDKSKRKLTEKFDKLADILSNLKLPEEIHLKCQLYYDEKQKIPIVHDASIYELLSQSIVTNFSLQQTAAAIKALEIIPSDQIELTKKFANMTQIKFFLPKQTIFRQNSLADGFFYIISGIVEVTQEIGKDFREFDFFAEQRVYEIQDQRHKKPTTQESDANKAFHLNSRNAKKVMPQESQISFSSPSRKSSKARQNQISPSQFSEYDLTENQFSSPSPVRKRDASPSPTETELAETFHSTDEKQVKWWQKCRAKPKEKMDQVDVSEVKLRQINELKVGNYFGELSLLTNLRRTATCYTYNETTTGWIAPQDFNRLMKENPDLKNLLTRKLYKYKDNHIRLLLTMLKNVPRLRKITMSSLRALAFLMRDQMAYQGTIILRLGQIEESAFFIREGEVKVYVKDPASEEKMLLAVLCKGSCFNFTNSFMGRPSLFDFEAATDVQLYAITQKDIVELVSTNHELLLTRNLIKSQGFKEVQKYDYQRMVYESINQLKRAQNRAIAYQKTLKFTVNQSKKQFSEYQKILISATEIKGYNESLGVGGNQEKMNNYHAVIQKIRKSSKMLVAQKFNIRNMKIFKLVDSYFDKFSGFTLNLDLAVMINQNEHTDQQAEQVNSYLDRIQSKIEDSAAKRTLSSGEDHLIKNINFFIKRKKGLPVTLHGTEAEERQIRMYNYKTTACRQAGLFKYQTKMLQALTSECFKNARLVDQLQRTLVENLKNNAEQIKLFQTMISLPEEQNKTLEEEQPNNQKMMLNLSKALQVIPPLTRNASSDATNNQDRAESEAPRFMTSVIPEESPQPKSPASNPYDDQQVTLQQEDLQLSQGFEIKQVSSAKSLQEVMGQSQSKRTLVQNPSRNSLKIKTAEEHSSKDSKALIQRIHSAGFKIERRKSQVRSESLQQEEQKHSMSRGVSRSIIESKQSLRLAKPVEVSALQAHYKAEETEEVQIPSTVKIQLASKLGKTQISFGGLKNLSFEAGAGSPPLFDTLKMKKRRLIDSKVLDNLPKLTDRVNNINLSSPMSFSNDAVSLPSIGGNMKEKLAERILSRRNAAISKIMISDDQDQKQ